MQQLIRLKLPIIADSVLSPEVHYGNSKNTGAITGIYFNTKDDQYGRITFENLDALKVCRGEMDPYHYDWSSHKRGVWVFTVKNSEWLKKRYQYEKEHYEGSYEFGGNVDEMLTDFHHFYFSFHDQFVEVIARGIWFEQSKKPLFGKALQKHHPFLPLEDDEPITHSIHGLTCWIHRNSKEKEALLNDAVFCTQKLFEFYLELNGKKGRPTHFLVISCRKKKIISRLLGSFGQELKIIDGIANLEIVLPEIEKYMKKVADRRKQMGFQD